MTGATKDELHAVAGLGAPEIHDSYSGHALDRAFGEYRARRREKITSFVPHVDGTDTRRSSTPCSPRPPSTS